MVAFFSAAVLAAFAPLLASAKLVITQPTPAGWQGNSTVTVAWTWDNDDPSFSIELGNPYIASGLLAAGPYAVANNINPNVNQFSFELPVVPPGNNYFIAFVAIDDVNTVYANSTSFPILNNPESSQLPQPSYTSTSHTGKTTSTHSATTTKLNSTSTASGPATTFVNTTSTTSSSFTQLVISTLSTASPTTSKSAAAAQFAGVSWTGVIGLVGTVVAAGMGALIL